MTLANYSAMLGAGLIFLIGDLFGVGIDVLRLAFCSCLPSADDPIVALRLVRLLGRLGQEYSSNFSASSRDM